MPFVPNGSRRGSRLLAAALGLALAALAPATAQAKTDKHDAANPDTCVPDHVLTNPFGAWGDQADYALAPGGDFESGAAGWTLTGGAAVAAGNQPFDIGAPGVLPRPATGGERPQRLDVRRRDLHVLPPLRPQPRVVEGGPQGRGALLRRQGQAAGHQRPRPRLRQSQRTIPRSMSTSRSIRSRQHCRKFRRYERVWKPTMSLARSPL